MKSLRTPQTHIDPVTGLPFVYNTAASAAPRTLPTHLTIDANAILRRFIATLPDKAEARIRWRAVGRYNKTWPVSRASPITHIRQQILVQCSGLSFGEATNLAEQALLEIERRIKAKSQAKPAKINCNVIT